MTSTQPRASGKTPEQAIPPYVRDTGIRVGIGGWVYPEWRGLFYPPDLKQSSELAYASRHVTAIEINGTYYGSQKPSSFESWADAVPDDFKFSVKASRYATNRRVLAESGDSINRFVHSGIERLGDKLGPLLWEFARTKVFDPADFEAFLQLLPRKVGTLDLRHVLDVRHPSFAVPDFVALARRYGVAIVFTDAPDLPNIGDRTADFVYIRCMEAQASLPEGYSDAALDAIALTARACASGERAANLPYIEATPTEPVQPARETYVYMINGAKERAPAAAMAVLSRLAKAVTAKD